MPDATLYKGRTSRWWFSSDQNFWLIQTRSSTVHKNLNRYFPAKLWFFFITLVRRFDPLGLMMIDWTLCQSCQSRYHPLFFGCWTWVQCTRPCWFAGHGTNSTATIRNSGALWSGRFENEESKECSWSIICLWDQLITGTGMRYQKRLSTKWRRQDSWWLGTKFVPNLWESRIHRNL